MSGFRRLELTIAFAVEVHRGQVYRGYGDRSDEPYILHCLRVMLAVPPELQVVAVLHDCKEDGDTVPPWLTEIEGMALYFLSRPKETAYEHYINFMVLSEMESAKMARAVKIADLRDNLAHDPPERLRHRYEAALAAFGASSSAGLPKPLQDDKDGK